MDSALELADYRRRVAASYAEVRSSTPSYATWMRWVGQRDALFREHPQSAIPDAKRDAFSGLSYFDYDPDLRITTRLEPIEGAPRADQNKRFGGRFHAEKLKESRVIGPSRLSSQDA